MLHNFNFDFLCKLCIDILLQVYHDKLQKGGDRNGQEKTPQAKARGTQRNGKPGSRHSRWYNLRPGHSGNPQIAETDKRQGRGGPISAPQYKMVSPIAGEAR